MKITEILDKYSVAFAVVVAGAMITGAVIFIGIRSEKSGEVAIGPNDEMLAEGEIGELYKNVQPVTDADHIFGNKDAKVKIINFSDMQCPYCIVFDETMKQIVADYDGQVAWVFRHSPLDFHENAFPAAEASECAAEIGGNDKFWAFLGKVTEKLETSSGSVNMVDVATSAGINKTAFENCYGASKYDEKISTQMSDAFDSGMEGTPYGIIVVDGNPVGIIDGAYPLEDVKGMIDQYLK
ncbi:MAG: thioredoxin domain-containing protein [Candidatus Colwellbacteria bacterium]|nr:thioredoxin domain-containing protein [Candidatus Colwellbacteria bacterium]